jgi:hypothetical protein
VVQNDVRAELRLAGLDPDAWKEVVDLARESLIYRQGRYHAKGALSPGLEREQRQQQAIQKVLRPIIRAQRKRSREQERRGEIRVDFLQPVKVQTEDGKEYSLMTRDLSSTGVRLIGTHRLLGQKVRLLLPREEGETPIRFAVRILWTCSVGDDLFENGGAFLELLPTE